MKKLLIGIMLLGMCVVGCGSNGGSSSSSGTEPVDPCAGPVPCLMDTWAERLDDGDIIGEYAIFYIDGDPENPIVVTSDGETVYLAGIDYVADPEGFGLIPVLVIYQGPVQDCYNGLLEEGGEDYDYDGYIDYLYSYTDGFLQICNKALHAQMIFDPELPAGEFDAAFDSMASFEDGFLVTEGPETLENVERIKTRIELIKDAQ